MDDFIAARKTRGKRKEERGEKGSSSVVLEGRLKIGRHQRVHRAGRGRGGRRGGRREISFASNGREGEILTLIRFCDVLADDLAKDVRIRSATTRGKVAHHLHVKVVDRGLNTRINTASKLVDGMRDRGARTQGLGGGLCALDVFDPAMDKLLGVDVGEGDGETTRIRGTEAHKKGAIL